MRVRDVMSTSVQTVAPDDTVGTARELLKRHGIDQLVVVSRKAVIGIAADRDLQPLPDESRVSEAMVKHPTTIESDETLRKAAGMMSGHAIGSLPVVDGGRLVGIVTTADLLRLLSKGSTHPAPNRERQILPKRGPRRKPISLTATEVSHVVQGSPVRRPRAGRKSRFVRGPR